MSELTDDGPPGSRRDWVLRRLRDRIASGELPAGRRLVERDVSAEYGISRGPVREAIMVLEQEGLVVAHAYRGAVVADVSQEEIAEVLVPVRLVIERAAFRAIATTRPTAVIDRLADLVRRMELADPVTDADRLADLDVAFHETVIAAGGGVQSSRIWHTIEPRVRSYFARDAPRHDRPDAVPEQHRELLDALCSGDPARVDATVEQHIRTYLPG